MIECAHLAGSCRLWPYPCGSLHPRDLARIAPSGSIADTPKRAPRQLSPAGGFPARAAPGSRTVVPV